MTTHTLIILDPDTLKPENSELIMRSGSLSALKKLSDQGFLAESNFNDAGRDVIRLLKQEQIVFRNVTDSDINKQSVNNQGESSSGSGAVADTGVDTDSDALNILMVSIDPSGMLSVNPGTVGASPEEKPFLFQRWDEASRHIISGYRSARHSRKTAETEINVAIRLDGSGECQIDTGIPFFDHMLEQIARHGYMDLEIICQGDLKIDEHHTIEDTAISLGETIGLALGDKRGIGRYGFVVAMDETRSLAAIDLSGRPWCVFEGTFHREKVGEFPTEMTSHFFHSLAMALRATLHVSVKGDNDHHQIEASFKALARCLRQAVDRNEKYLDILPSSKGLL